MKIPIIILLSILYFETFSQNLNVEGTPILLPRMTSIEMGQISPIPGMVLFNSDRNQFLGFVKDNIFLSMEKSSICVFPPGGTDEIDLSDYSIKLDFGPNLPDSILVAIDLFSLSDITGSLALYDSDPCYTNIPIAQTSENYYFGSYSRFTFITPVTLTPDQSYWLVTQTGTTKVLNTCFPTSTVSAYSYIPPPSPGEYCSLQNAAPLIRLIGVGEWVVLH